MTDLTLMQRKFYRQVSQVASEISMSMGIKNDGIFVVLSSDAICYITLQKLIERADGQIDYLLTFRLPMVHQVQRTTVLYEWVATHTRIAYFNRIICEGDDGASLTTVTVEHHLLYESMSHRELRSILVMLFGMYDKYAIQIQQAFGGMLPRQMTMPVYTDDWISHESSDDSVETRTLSSKRDDGALVLEAPKPKEKKSLAEMRNDVHAIFAEIDTMVGLKSVRRVLEKIVAQQWAADILKQRHPDRKIVFSKHLVFTGAPGTGKTTMARYVGRLYAAINVLPSHKFVEVSSADLIAQYVGQTAPRVRAKMLEARGGILFIDEAYALMPRGEQSYGHEALAELVLMMENMRNDLVVIMAGYSDQMHEMIDVNPGLRSRMSTFVDFPDYAPDELSRIFCDMVVRHGLTVGDDVHEYLAAEISQIKTNGKHEFGNARFARSLWEAAFTELAHSEFEDETFTADELRVIQKVHVERALVTLMSGLRQEQKRIGFRPSRSKHN
jgi:hypothetical protein